MFSYCIIMDINHSWKATCRILLGDEIGDIDDYQDYLLQYVSNGKNVQSSISGKDVIVPANGSYGSAKFISNDEREKYAALTGKFELNLDEIKDIDSITDALKERIYYSGNVVLGNSKDVGLSNRISNSTSVYRSEGLSDSKHSGYCCMVRYADHAFGCSTGGDCKFSIKAFEVYKTMRCMETLRVYTSSDCYYSSNLESCSDCMFSFNQRNSRNMIGNLQLPPERYAAIKAKLVGDFRENLRAKKKVMSIVELIGDGNE
ncbi:MAG: hypothetical protein ABII71_03840 [Candidatus Micrarchaeota archaeon]